MDIDTTRFGRISVAGDRLFELPRGLYGFAHLRLWALWEHRPGNPFCWLQSAEEPATALLVTRPDLFLPGYAERVCSALDLDEASVLVLCAVALDRAERRVRANLCGPIVVDRGSRRGAQHVLDLDGLEKVADLIDPDRGAPARADGAEREASPR